KIRAPSRPDADACADPFCATPATPAIPAPANGCAPRPAFPPRTTAATAAPARATPDSCDAPAVSHAARRCVPTPRPIARRWTPPPPRARPPPTPARSPACHARHHRNSTQAKSAEPSCASRTAHGTHETHGKIKPPNRKMTASPLPCIPCLPWAKKFCPSEHKTLVLDLGKMSEVHQQAHSQPGCVEIVLNLRPMLIGQPRDGLDLNQNLSEADKIRDIALFEQHPLVAQRQRHLSLKRHSLKPELQLQTLLEHRLQKSTALVLIDLKAGPEYPVSLFF